MIEKILGQNIYNRIDMKWCNDVKEYIEESKQRDLQYLYQLCRQWNAYYNGSLHDINFGMFYRFFVQLGICYMKEIIAEAEEKLIYEGMEIDFAENLVKAIEWIPVRCLIKEIQAYNTAGKLKGDTPQQKYIYFEEMFLKKPDYIRNVCEIYPELLRLILVKIKDVVGETVEILTAVHNHKKEIIENFTGKNCFYSITSLTLGQSDMHENGETVSVVELDHRWKFIYRPRSSEKYKLFYDIYEWLLDGSGIKSSRRRYLDYETYSMEEYVQSTSCSTRDEVQRYFFRMGVLLFLCYLTDTSDIHGENIISNGEFPELIDLETMPGISMDLLQLRPEGDTVQKSIIHSVLDAGILPKNFW